MSQTNDTDARRISQMRNLGPVCESDLGAAGIRTAAELINLGAEAAFVKMLNVRKQRGRSVQCCNAAYLYALHGAIHDIDWRDIPEAKKREFKTLTAEMRASGLYRED